MPDTVGQSAAVKHTQRLGVLSLSFLWRKRLRRILNLAGYDLVTGIPGVAFDGIGVWGRQGVAWRGRAVARMTGRPILTLEDPFLRSVRSGVAGEPPNGMVIDDLGIYYDATCPSRLEHILEHDEGLGEEEAAPSLLARWQSLRLSKYNDWPDDPPDPPDPGFVLVLDQTANDASIRFGRASGETFRHMLAAARAENANTPILIRTHPDVSDGRRRGHFSDGDLGPGVSFLNVDCAPAALFARASRVYCVTSQSGFEAILHGHRPRVFGMPFYAGWGLSDDEQSCARRTRKLSPTMLFSGAMLRYPVWYDPIEDALCGFGAVMTNIACQAEAWRANRARSVALNVRMWKRGAVSGFLRGANGAPIYDDSVSRAIDKASTGARRLVVWAGKEPDDLAAKAGAAHVPVWRLEDGFLRSSGLGADLIPPASLVLDDLGIYFDPRGPSRLEALIADSVHLQADELARAEALRVLLLRTAVTKYNIGARAWTRPGDLEARPVILVPGQVEDDASIRLGCGETRTNLALLETTRRANPTAYVVYKPHPDIERGLRPGKVPRALALDHADEIVSNVPVAALLDQVDAVWTMTSLMGFEALLRTRAVTVLGQPFYAGWGLTDDRGEPMPRRTARPGLTGLIHAALIDYPMYRDPVTGLATSPERIVERLASGHPSRPTGPVLRVLSRAQRRLAATPFWR